MLYCPFHVFRARRCDSNRDKVPGEGARRVPHSLYFTLLNYGAGTAAGAGAVSLQRGVGARLGRKQRALVKLFEFLHGGCERRRSTSGGERVCDSPGLPTLLDKSHLQPLAAAPAFNSRRLLRPSSSVSPTPAEQSLASPCLRSANLLGFSLITVQGPTFSLKAPALSHVNPKKKKKAKLLTRMRNVRASKGWEPEGDLAPVLMGARLFSSTGGSQLPHCSSQSPLGRAACPPLLCNPLAELWARR